LLIMQTPLASSISLAAEILAGPLGWQSETVTVALSNPDMAKAQCNKCARNSGYLSLHLARDINQNCSRSRSRSKSGDRSSRSRSRSRSSDRPEGLFAVLCDECSPKGKGVQLRRHVTNEPMADEQSP